jgi:hypothetical protein
VNSGNFNALKVAKGTEIIYSSFQSKLKSGSWTPNDVEKLADFFKKPIAYFFDREEKPYTIPDIEPDIANDGNNCCRRCKDLEKQITLLEKLLAVYENPPKKETGNGNNPQSSESANRSKAS